MRAEGGEALLVAWLEELVVRLFARGEVLAGLDGARLTEEAFSARAAWRPLGPGERPVLEVKAATYHGLAVLRRGGRWRARVVLDV